MVATGTQLGPYKILGPLGAGGMGEVYRAQDGRLGRDVALKVLPEQFAGDPDRVVRFEREARAVAALSHPNILCLHDFGTEHGLAFAVTELLEGQTLRKRLANGGLPWRKAVELAVAIADGVAFAHGKGIVHRDLKPENVFVTADERIKILDFGLAKILNEELPTAAVETQASNLTKTGTILGTAPYMSPEQLRGEEVDARSDIFSFGCILYEMLTGKRPFTGRTYADMAGAILHSDPPDLAEAGIKVPLDLERLIRRCLEKNPEARFQSARDLAFALRGIGTSSAEVQVMSPPAPPRANWWLAAGCFLVAAAVLTGAFWPRNAASNDPDFAKVEPAALLEVAVLPFAIGARDAEADYLGDGLPAGIIKNLTQVANLKVRSFSTVSRFRNPDLNLGDMGRKLKVQAVLTGKIWPRKDSFAVGIELVNVADDSVLWSERYDTTTTDLQSIQLTIARQMCARLNVTMTADEEKRLAKRYTDNPEAFHLYVKGRYHWFQETEAGWKKAAECFRQAISIDPAYALAHAGLADTYFASSGRVLPPRQAAPMARKSAQNSLDLDENLAEAHIALGNVLFWHDWDWPGAEKEFKRAIQLNPSLALAHDAYFTYLVLLGRFEEADKAMQKAIQLDPLTPYINIDAAWLDYYSRRFDQAIEHSRKVIEVDHRYGNAHWISAMSHVKKGEYAKALVAFQRLRQLDDTPLALASVAYGHGVSGDKKTARKLLGELTALAQRRYVDPAAFAVIHLGLGDKDQTYQWLEKAQTERSGLALWLKTDPQFDSLRGEPKFGELVKRMNYPEPDAQARK
jgi:eukaryotic-like serine/threonine-protein kinase